MEGETSTTTTLLPPTSSSSSSNEALAATTTSITNDTTTNSSPKADCPVVEAATAQSSSSSSSPPSIADSTPATPTEKRAPLSDSAKKKYLFATATRNAKRLNDPVTEGGAPPTLSIKEAKEVASGLVASSSTTSLLPASASTPTATTATTTAATTSTTTTTTSAPPAAPSTSNPTLSPPESATAKSPRKSVSATNLLLSHESKREKDGTKQKKVSEKEKEKEKEKENAPKTSTKSIKPTGPPKNLKQHKVAEGIIRDLKQRLRDEKSLKRYLQNQTEDLKRQELTLQRKLEQIQDSTTDATLLFPAELSGYTSSFTGRGGMSNEDLLEQVAFTRDQWRQESGNARETFAEVTRTLHEKAHLESELRTARRNLALSGFRLVKKKEPKEAPKPQPGGEQADSETPQPTVQVPGATSDEKQLNKMKQVTAARERGKAVEAERAKIAEDFLSAHARLRDKIEKARRDNEVALDEMALLQLELSLVQNRDMELEAENARLEHMLKTLVSLLPPEVPLSFSRDSVFVSTTVSADKTIPALTVQAASPLKKDADSKNLLPPIDLRALPSPSHLNKDSSHEGARERSFSLSMPSPSAKAAAYAQIQTMLPNVSLDEVVVVLADPDRTDEDYWNYLKEVDFSEEEEDFDPSPSPSFGTSSLSNTTPIASLSSTTPPTSNNLLGATAVRTPRKTQHSTLVVVSSEGAVTKLISPRPGGGLTNLSPSATSISIPTSSIEPPSPRRNTLESPRKQSMTSSGKSKKTPRELMENVFGKFAKRTNSQQLPPMVSPRSSPPPPSTSSSLQSPPSPGTEASESTSSAAPLSSTSSSTTPTNTPRKYSSADEGERDASGEREGRGSKTDIKRKKKTSASPSPSST